MAGDQIDFVIDGSEERRGAIPTDAFIAKLRAFIATIYAFDRAFSRRPKRQLELEIVDLTRNSPGTVAMQARSTAQGYPAQESIAWTFGQLDRIYRGEPVDRSVPQSALDAVVDLASVRAARLPELGIMKARYAGKIIQIDQVLEGRALAARAQMVSDERLPWRPGVSRGSLFGELRGVMDFEGERQFYILPPSGPAKVQCIFSEDLRDALSDSLFKAVRVTGFLHYDGLTPHPVLMEATAIGQVKETGVHLSDIAGLFRDSDPPSPIEDWG